MKNARFAAAFLAAALSAAAAAAPPPGAARPPSAPSLCDCLRNRVCWGLSMTAFTQTFADEKTEIEGALPGRFFPGTFAWALRGVDKNGHFLRVECGRKRKPCPSYRPVLERRLMVSAFLSAVPRRGPLEDYFNPKTWEIKPAGIDVLKEAGRCRPKFWTEAQAAVGVRVED